jgi:hypothetical protein
MYINIVAVVVNFKHLDSETTGHNATVYLVSLSMGHGGTNLDLL